MLDSNTPEQNDPIDAVITWVDGSDPAHIEKRLKRQGQAVSQTDTAILAGKDETRFKNNNEIKYCLHSIRLNAPWIRNIYLVTDNQVPDFLNSPILDEMNITIVDHKTIFGGYEDSLPTFNSLSIETVLWRIPGLSEKFIYFNDDFFLINTTTRNDFFDGDKVVLRGQYKKRKRYGKLHWKFSKFLNSIAKKYFNISRSMSTLQQMIAADQAYPDSTFFKSGHTPYPLKKSTLEKYFTENPKKLKDNIKHPFRDSTQFATTALANHIEIRNGTVLTSEHESTMICFNRDGEKEIKQKINSLFTSNSKFLCIQSLEQAPEILAKDLNKYLNNKISFAAKA